MPHVIVEKVTAYPVDTIAKLYPSEEPGRLGYVVFDHAGEYLGHASSWTLAYVLFPTAQG